MTKSKLSMFAFGVLSLTILFFFICVTANAAAPAGTISYWRLDEADNYTPAVAVDPYLDSVGTNDGASTGGGDTVSPTPTAGRVGVGQTFGPTTGIDVLTAADFNFAVTDSFSIECWVRGAATASTQVFVGRIDAAAAGGALQMWVGMRPTGRAVFRLEIGGVTFTEEGETAVIDASKFYHVVAVRDANLDQIRLYVDGALDTAAPESATYTAGIDSTEALNIGQLAGGSHFGGSIDEVAIYNTALTDDEVDEHYLAGLAGVGIDPLPPQPAEAPASTISYWKLDEADNYNPAVAVDPYLDSIGSNDGASTGGGDTVSPTPTAGRVGVGQAFGPTTGIDVLTVADFNFAVTDSFSIECWVRGAATASTQVFVGRIDAAAAGGAMQMWVGMRPTGRAVFRLEIGGVTFTEEGETAVIDASKFYHVVAVRDANLDQIRLYVDGALDTAAPESATYTAGIDSTEALNIGQLTGGAHFVGSIDEVVIYNTALTDDEVDEHYLAGLAGEGIDTIVPIPAPVAIAVADPTNPEENIEVTLDGTASTPVGTLSYLWEQVPPGTSVNLTGALTATAKFTPPVGTAGEELTFKLTVTDGFGQKDDETVKVNVASVASLPVADADAPPSVTEGDPVTLDGTESTPKGMISYLWEQLPGGTQVLPAAGVPAATADFTAPQVDAAGMILTFKLTVTDGLNQTDSDTVTVTVNDNPLAPTADAGDDQDAKEGNTVTLDGSSSIAAAGSTITTYLWEQVLPGTPVQLAGASTDTATFTAPDVDETLTFRLTVTDDNNLTSSATTNVNVSKSGGGGGGGGGGGCFINSMF